MEYDSPGERKVLNRTVESRTVLLVESGIQFFGTRNSAQGIRNPAKIKIWIPSSILKESGIHSVESESNIPLDYLTWGDRAIFV